MNKDELINSLRAQLVRNSFSYRLGRFLTAPLRIIVDSIRAVYIPGNKSWLFKQLLIVSLKNPGKTIRKINLYNIGKLFKALKVEDPVLTLRNSSRYINSSGKNGNSRVTDLVTHDDTGSKNDRDIVNNNQWVEPRSKPQPPVSGQTTGNLPVEMNYSVKQDEFDEKKYVVNESDTKSTESLFLAVQILSILESECKKIVIACSHDNYLETAAGVQIYMNNERKAFSLRSVSYLQIHPQTPVSLYAPIDDILLNVCLNTELICTVTAKEFIRLGGMLARQNNVECVGVIIHHLLNWSLQVLDQFLREINNEKLFFWLHDYYICCPQVNLLRNDKEFCNKPDIESNSCMICMHGNMRRSNSEHLKLFLNKYHFTFLAPSKVVRSIIVSEYPELKDKIIVSHLLNIIKRENKRDRVLKDLNDPLYKLKIAYLGVPKRYKGWDTWRLFVDSSVSSPYKCVYLSTEKVSVPEEHIYINALNNNNKDSIINLLIRHKVDIVILWSIWPETFSFTLYEAIAAGCFIITNPLSGNIAAYVRENSCGIVLKSEKDLISLFEEPQQLRKLLIEFHQGNINYSDLIPNIYTATLLFKEQSAP